MLYILVDMQIESFRFCRQGCVCVCVCCVCVCARAKCGHKI